MYIYAYGAWLESHPHSMAAERKVYEHAMADRARGCRFVRCEQVGPYEGQRGEVKGHSSLCYFVSFGDADGRFVPIERRDLVPADPQTTLEVSK